VKHPHEIREMIKTFLSKDLVECGHLGNGGADGRII
jgi:hypothetical protein